MFVPFVEEVARILDAEREKLVASLEEGRAAILAGDCDPLAPGTLRKEFEAILADNPSDDVLDAIMGRTRPASG